ncbi:oxidoreductase [Agrobacterium deltaense]|uniref:LLM class flavin-dependent oxidoreductase n=1 Tax=Agrobacterium TaxID=357 RepID=UPI000745ABD0|nr:MULTISPECIES: LLM class flavin-dependent oxidoreductase [Agrobacterium]KVK53996.1 hypothetical protein L901_19110 [Agrobacterium sp. D14]RKF40662.1 oxidoreductase [Agrobacterium deltaense]
MELGVFSLSDINPDSGDTAASRIVDIIDYGKLAERHGLDIYGVGEHHSPAFAVSSPAIVLSAIAQATSRIKLTTTATVLTVLDPVRLYQDFATLDLISRGRAEIIAGRSAFAEPFVLFGEDMASYGSTFAEKLDLLLRIRSQDLVTWQGSVRPALNAARIAPRTIHDLPVWVAVGGTPESAQRAGCLGLPMMLGLISGTIDQAKRTVDLYREAGRIAGYGDDVLSVGITSHLYVGETEGDARERFFPYYQRYLSPRTNGGRGWHVERTDMDRTAGRRGALMVGNPQEIATKILDMRNALNIDRFMGQIDLGGMPKDMVVNSIRLFGEVVAPAVRHVLSK